MGIAIGIDLGTTNSAVSVVRPTGVPEVLRNKEGDTVTPSVVLFQSFGGADEPLVGEQAKRQAAAFPRTSSSTSSVLLATRPGVLTLLRVPSTPLRKFLQLS